MSKPAIVVDDVSMKFNLSKEKVDSLKEYVIKSILMNTHERNNSKYHYLI